MAASIKSGELSAADSESTGDREVEGMRMGYLPDTMKEDLAENTVSFHLSVLLSSLSTHCCEQVMNPPSWLLVFIFCLHHSVSPPPAASDISDICCALHTQF